MRGAPVLAVVASLAWAAAPARADCLDADTLPSAQDAAQLGAATLCLLNEQRSQHGLPALRSQPELAQAAGDYAADMVAWQFFGHVTPGGRSLSNRIDASGYLRPAGIWALGENIAWASGTISTPRQVVAAWMASPPHRANVLERAFRDIGVGVAFGVPVEPQVLGATFATDFGSRTLHRARSGAWRSAAPARRRYRLPGVAAARRFSSSRRISGG